MLLIVIGVVLVVVFLCLGLLVRDANELEQTVIDQEGVIRDLILENEALKCSLQQPSSGLTSPEYIGRLYKKKECSTTGRLIVSSSLSVDKSTPERTGR